MYNLVSTTCHGCHHLTLKKTIFDNSIPSVFSFVYVKLENSFHNFLQASCARKQIRNLLKLVKQDWL